MSEPSMTVVLIEDDRQIRRFVRTTLEAEGIECASMPKPGKQGLVEAATRKPDLIVVDSRPARC
jgi:two-component system KDP operon response regulator KdpE